MKMIIHGLLIGAIAILIGAIAFSFSKSTSAQTDEGKAVTDVLIREAPRAERPRRSRPHHQRPRGILAGGL
jgi:hypothetical protein